MLGQLCVEPEPEPEPEVEPEELLDDPGLVLPEPEFPDPVLDEGVVVEEPEPEPEPVPELPVVVEVVAALATSAPPARRPELSAPMASTLRRRKCMGRCPFVSVKHQPIRAGTPHLAPRT